MSKHYRSPSHNQYRERHGGADTLEIKQTRHALAEIAKEGKQTGPILGYHGDGKLGRHHTKHLNLSRPILRSHNAYTVLQQDSRRHAWKVGNVWYTDKEYIDPSNPPNTLTQRIRKVQANQLTKLVGI